MVRSRFVAPETGAKRPWSKSENVSQDSEGIELTPYGAALFGQHLSGSHPVSTFGARHGGESSQSHYMH
jgi:hypothetical protein